MRSRDARVPHFVVTREARMKMSELEWHPDNRQSSHWPGNRCRSQKLVPVWRATYAYKNKQCWVVKRVPPHTRAGMWTVRTQKWHPGGTENGHMDLLEVAVFIAQLRPARTWRGWLRRILCYHKR